MPLHILLAELNNCEPYRNCQFILSVGTGSKREVTQVSRPEEGNFLVKKIRNCAAARVFSAYEWLLRGSVAWESQTSAIEAESQLKDRCVRLNVEFDSTEPRLDDVQAMKNLKERAWSDPTISATIDSMAKRIIASLFYFELDSMPEHHYHAIQGTGKILCLRKAEDPALPLLVEKLVSLNARFAVNGRVQSGNLLSAALWDSAGNFRFPVSFLISDQNLAISLTWPDGTGYPISGGPFLVDKLVKAQRLDAYFGHPDHRRRRDISNHRAWCESGRVEQGPRHKRRASGGDEVQRRPKRSKLSCTAIPMRSLA